MTDRFEANQGTFRLHRSNTLLMEVGHRVVPEPTGKIVCFDARDAPIFLNVERLPSGPTKVWRNGKEFTRKASAEGGVSTLYDFAHVWAGQAFHPLDNVTIWFPRSTFLELEAEYRHSILEHFLVDPTRNRHDPVLSGLATTLQHAFRAPSELNQLYVDHLFEALRFYVARTYAGLQSLRIPEKGALTPLRQRRVEEAMLNDLAVVPTLTDLASIAGLSVSHFRRAFRTSTGLPPHRWLLMQRIEVAKRLLAGRNSTLSEVAYSCGFSDQSHLSRAFSKAVGISPGSWRRSRR